MSLLRPESSERAVESVLVGFLLIFIDFPLGGIDIVPDVLGWVMVAFALGRLRPVLSRTAPARLGSIASILAWVSVVLTGTLLALNLFSVVGAGDVAASVVIGPLAYPFFFVETIAMLGIAALTAFVEGHARRAGAYSTTLKFLRAGWIVALVSAGMSLVTVLSVLSGGGALFGPFLIRVISLAAGIVAGIGISRCRSESVL